jgi:hypothetical protein
VRKYMKTWKWNESLVIYNLRMHLQNSHKRRETRPSKLMQKVACPIDVYGLHAFSVSVWEIFIVLYTKVWLFYSNVCMPLMLAWTKSVAKKAFGNIRCLLYCALSFLFINNDVNYFSVRCAWRVCVEDAIRILCWLRYGFYEAAD